MISIKLLLRHLNEVLNVNFIVLEAVTPNDAQLAGTSATDFDRFDVSTRNFWKFLPGRAVVQLNSGHLPKHLRTHITLISY